MGQRVSNCEDNNIVPSSKKECGDSKLKLKKSTRLTNKKYGISSAKSSKNRDVDTEATKFEEISNIERLHNLKNLRMTRNFTQFAGANNVAWTHTEKKNEDYSDSLSEKDFQIISYEEMMPIQLVEKEKIVKNCSTLTHDLKTLALEAVYGPGVIEQGASCKEENVIPEHDTTLDGWQIHDKDHVSSGDDDEFLDIEISDEERIRWNELYCGQNGPTTNRILDQDECGSSPQDYECIDDGLDFVEERLRNIMIDLGDELKKVKDMEHRLSNVPNSNYNAIASTTVP